VRRQLVRKGVQSANPTRKMAVRQFDFMELEM